MDIGNYIYIYEGQIDNYKVLSLAGWNWMKIYTFIILINYLRQRLAWVVVAKLEVHYNGKCKKERVLQNWISCFLCLVDTALDTSAEISFFFLVSLCAFWTFKIEVPWLPVC